MTVANRLKFTVAITSAATITPPASPNVAGYRALAQAIAATDLAANTTGVPLICEDASNNWEESYFSVSADGLSFVRTSVAASSAGGTTPATFSGTVTVYCTPFADYVNRLVCVRAIAFAQSVPLTQPGSSYMPPQTVAGALTFTPAASAVQGALVYLRLTADGTNTPNFSAFKEWGGSSGYDNRTGIVNQIQFFCDGYDNWFSASQAVGAVAVAAPASAVTMSLSSSSVASGSPVTVTVGANNPLTGSQTESVTLTAPVAGAWSANPVTLNATTGTATPTFTPSATGSGNITATATGTPTLTGASAALTVTAAATAPGAPTGVTATAGDTTASVNGTAPASNGGAAITSYTATATPAGGGTAITATNATLPVPLTGLTNGVTYNITLHATNSVPLSGPESSPAVSVTPVAAGASVVRLSPRSADLSESASAPWGYTGTGVTYGAASGGIATQSLQSGVDGSLSQKFTGYVAGSASTSSETMLGMQSGSTVVAFSALPCAFYTDSANSQYTPFSSGVRQTPTSVLQPIDGDIQRMRSSGTSRIAEVARAASPTVFTTIYTWANVSTGVLRFQSVSGTKPGTISSLTGVALA